MENIPDITLSMSAAATVAGALVALIFNFFPKLNVWFALHPAEFKQNFMAVAGLVVAFAGFGLSCANLININVPCTSIGAFNIAFMWVGWVVGNQSADRALKKPQAVVEAKADAKAQAAADQAWFEGERNN